VRLLPLGRWLKVGELWLREGRAGDDPRCADQPDIQVEGGHLLEVKGRGFAFTSPEDYPYSTAFLGSTRRWQARTILPCCVVLFSEPTGKLLVVPTSTRSRWVIEQSFDTRRGFTEQSWAAPRELLLPEARLLSHLRGSCRQSQQKNIFHQGFSE